MQAQLAANAVRRRHGMSHRDPALLAGMIRDTAGRRMTPSHAARGSIRYLYYVSVNGVADHTRNQGTAQARKRPSADAQPILRLPASDIERAVIDNVTAFVNDQHMMLPHLPGTLTADQMHTLAHAASKLATQLGSGAPSERRAILLDLGVQVTAGEGQITVSLNAIKLQALMGVNNGDAGDGREDATNDLNDSLTHQPDDSDDEQVAQINLTPVAMEQHPIQGRRLIIAPQDNTPARRPDPKLLALIARARQARSQLMGDLANPHTDMDCSPKHLARTAQLGYLSPKIITLILDGRQPASLTARKLSRINQLPLLWQDQEKLLGIN